MKKVALLIALGGVFAMSSCKKDWNCDCTVDTLPINGEILDAKKGDAEEACQAVADGWTALGADASCTLSAK